MRNTPVPHLLQMTKQPPRWVPGVVLHTAYRIAAREFATISRKGGDIPYLAHLLAVSALVIEHGGSEEQAAAALLHDVLEDSQVSPVQLGDQLIEAGVPRDSAERIVALVQGTSDGEHGQERSAATWRERKAAYHRLLAAKPSDDPSLLVSLADKVHNAESTLVQVRAGETVSSIFAQFNAGPVDQQWNYAGLHATFVQHAERNPALQRLVTRFGYVLAEIFPQ
ncbi:MAG: hypothetical protein RLZZ518_932 [Actinomycetota bacterium]